jgi:iron complex outermembrane receptor protein
MKVTSWVGASLVLGVAGSASAWAAAADSASAGASDNNNVPVLNEVVVTAERRNTDLQRTPIAATVLSGADLGAKGIVTVDQLQTAMPSVTVQNFGQGNDFNIRGIGKGEHNTQTSTGVIIYRDGVATFPGYFQDEPFYDIGSLEVLRGPQGTFVGQNATGGAVFITEANPTLGGFNGYVLGQYGNYNDAMLQGAVNLPVSDTVAARVAFYDEYRDTFYHITGPFTGGNGTLKESSLRLSLLWKPSDALKVVWKNDYNYIDSGGYPADPATATNDLFHITANAEQLAIDQFARSVLNVDYTFANGITLRSISGYQWGRTAYDADLDGTSAGFTTFQDAVKEKIYSEEINLISPDHGFLTWVGGLYYQANNYYFPVGHFDIGLPPGIYDYDLDGVNLTNTAAAFGQLTFNLPADWQFQLGVRYSHSDSTNHVRIYTPEPAFASLLPDHQSEHDDKVTGKAALSWAVDSDNFLYAFVATGYKAGGLNVPSSFTLPQPFRAEYVTDYEIGWKATAFDGHLRTQLGGYYTDYKNFQVTIDNPTEPTLTLEVNNPSATKLYGVEMSAQAAIGNLALDFAAAVAHSSLGAFYANDPRFAGVAVCDPRSGPASTGCVNLSGHPQTYAPTVTVDVGGQYVIHVGGNDTLTPRVNYAHIGSQWATLFDQAALGDHLQNRNLLSAQLVYQHGDWSVAGYGENLTDDHYVSAVISGLRFAGAPRQYGIRVSRSF